MREKLNIFGHFSLSGGVNLAYTHRTAGTISAFHTALPNRGNRDISSRRQGHLPESWSGHRRTNRGEDDSRHDLRLLSSSDRGQRDDRARSGAATSTASACAARSRDDEVERLFGLLGDGKIDNHQNWKGRFKDNSDKMRSGSIYEVADVLKSLTFLAKSKSLSFREKRMLDRAKFLIISEVSEVMRETAAAIEGRVDHALERCFTAKARTAPPRAEGGQGRAARTAAGAARAPHARRARSAIRRTDTSQSTSEQAQAR